jgi:hypothetical protein
MSSGIDTVRAFGRQCVITKCPFSASLWLWQVTLALAETDSQAAKRVKTEITTGGQPRTARLQFPSCPLDATPTPRGGAHSIARSS